VTPHIRLAAAHRTDFGRRPLVAGHDLDRCEMFCDAALIELLDNFPRRNLHAMTMGTDLTRPDEIRMAQNEGVSGAELMRAVKGGRLWLNITRVDRADQRYRRLINELYAQLAEQVPGLSIDSSQGTLLISSPQALVYYHLDGPASVLWHIRGRKRVWVYPALDERYVQRSALEDIMAGARHEYLPYETAYDQGAEVLDLEPGQWASWPQNAPHRVTNLDGVNVSLATEHFTRSTRRRARVYSANRYFRTHFGQHGLSARESGPAAAMKAGIHLLVRKAGLDPVHTKRHIASMRVDADAPGGAIALERSIDVRCFQSLEEAAHLRAEVNALNRSSARPDPFSTFEFFEAYLRHDEFFPGGRGMQLWFLAAFDAGQLVGYLVLKLVNRRVMGMGAATLGFLVTHDNDRPHLVAQPQLQQQVGVLFYQYLLGRGNEWSLLELQQQDGSSALFPPPAAIELKGYLVRQWPNLENATIQIRWGSLREYLQALSKKFRTNLKRQMRNLLAAGEVQILSSSDPATTAVLFELYRSIEPHSWKSQANADIGRHPQRVEYFRSLLDADQPMRVSIHLLLLDDVPIAGLINGSFMQDLYALHVVYDDRAGRLGPGSAILMMGIREAIDGHCASFNLLSGSGHFKTRWLAKMTQLHIAQIYRIGSPLYWRRRLGDMQRRWFARKSAATPGPYNPLRREIGELPYTPATPDERQRVAAMVADARRRRPDVLDAAQFAALI
jgi:Acetyltransferase (GNAT) domain